MNFHKSSFLQILRRCIVTHQKNALDGRRKLHNYPLGSSNSEMHIHVIPSPHSADLFFCCLSIFGSLHVASVSVHKCLFVCLQASQGSSSFPGCTPGSSWVNHSPVCNLMITYPLRLKISSVAARLLRLLLQCWCCAVFILCAHASSLWLTCEYDRDLLVKRVCLQPITRQATHSSVFIIKLAELLLSCPLLDPWSGLVLKVWEKCANLKINNFVNETKQNKWL